MEIKKHRINAIGGQLSQFDKLPLMQLLNNIYINIKLIIKLDVLNQIINHKVVLMPATLNKTTI